VRRNLLDIASARNATTRDQRHDAPAPSPGPTAARPPRGSAAPKPPSAAPPPPASARHPPRAGRRAGPPSSAEPPRERSPRPRRDASRERGAPPRPPRTRAAAAASATPARHATARTRVQTARCPHWVSPQRTHPQRLLRRARFLLFPADSFGAGALFHTSTGKIRGHTITSQSVMPPAARAVERWTACENTICLAASCARSATLDETAQDAPPRVPPRARQQPSLPQSAGSPPPPATGLGKKNTHRLCRNLNSGTHPVRGTGALDAIRPSENKPSPSPTENRIAPSAPPGAQTPWRPPSHCHCQPAPVHPPSIRPAGVACDHHGAPHMLPLQRLSATSAETFPERACPRAFDGVQPPHAASAPKPVSR
jgi:hypothetical protein